MTMETWTSRWWEAAVVVLAAYSVLVGVLVFGSDHVVEAITFGFVPAVLLVAGLALRKMWDNTAVWMLLVGSVLAGATVWHIYNVVLALVVIFGGVGSGKIGAEPAKASAATG